MLFLLSSVVIYLGKNAEVVNFESNVIPVVMAPDDTLACAAVVVITSMLENANTNTFYQVYLFVPGNFKVENKAVVNILKEKYNSCDIIFVDMKNQYCELIYRRWPPATYYRLQIAGRLVNLAKCIYLDCDVVVRHDLTEMHSIIMDDYYVAGIWASSWKPYLFTVLKIPDGRQYVCSGVLVMNLEKMRKDKLENDFTRVLKSKAKVFKYTDQDVINAVCYGRILCLPLKFGIMINIRVSYGGNIFVNARDPTIVHFAWNPKPWIHHTSTIFHEEFWNYARKADLCKEIEELGMHSRYRIRNERKTRSGKKKWKGMERKNILTKKKGINTQFSRKKKKT